MTETSTPIQITPPTDFEFNTELLVDYDEQVEIAIAEAAHQAKAIPSFEAVPTVDITPSFNPTGASDDEVYARNRIPRGMHRGWALRSTWTDDPEPVVMWRIVERSKLEDGTGLTSSRILQSNSVGDVEKFRSAKHLASMHDTRMSGEDKATPFVSFSTDPERLAKQYILRHGFGIKGGLDSVVVRVHVDPNRVITGRKNKCEEVLLLGGVAPDEFDAAYSVADFIAQLVPDREVTTVSGDIVHRDRAIGYWALQK